MFDSAEFPKTTPVFTDDWRRVLWEAADYIETHGWCTHATFTGPTCIMGAVRHVADVPLWSRQPKDGTEFLDFPAIGNTTAMTRFAEFIGWADPTNLYRWNDAPERTAEEVISTLRKCAMEG